MEITQIRYFLEVAESEHITNSAEKLHIAQPALSQAIHRLEDELGVPLFVRSGRNISITKYGNYLRQKLAPFMDALDEIPQELSEMKNLEQHTVYLNVLAASTLITNAIIRFKSLHRDAMFKFLQNSGEELYDLEITTHLFYQKNEGRDGRCFIRPEQIFLAVPNEGKYAGLESIRLCDMENEGFIGLMGSRQFRTICDKFCRHADIRPEYIFESDNPAAVQNMIAANMGVGFWPEFSWGSLHNPNVRLLPVSDIPCSRDLIIRLNKNSVTPYAKEFFDFLKDTI